MWDSASNTTSDRSCVRPLTLATIHYYAQHDNPDGYNRYKAQHFKTTINFPFTPDRIITEQYISKATYETAFETKPIVAIKSCMKTSKTFTLSKIFGQIKRSKYKTILAVYFRVSLSKELVEMWRELGFELYSDIKGPINLKDHPRVVIQIDSLPRVTNRSELLILDEIESTTAHLCSSVYLNKQTAFNAL